MIEFALIIRVACALAALAFAIRFAFVPGWSKSIYGRILMGLNAIIAVTLMASTSANFIDPKYLNYYPLILNILFILLLYFLVRLNLIVFGIKEN